MSPCSPAQGTLFHLRQQSVIILAAVKATFKHHPWPAWAVLHHVLRVLAFDSLSNPGNSLITTAALRSLLFSHIFKLVLWMTTA